MTENLAADDVPGKYCLGFVFHEQGLQSVLLQRKKRPNWQRDKFNGIGGKLKVGESGAQAMSREAHEEAGLSIDHTEWLHFADLRGKGFDVQCFAVRNNLQHVEMYKTDEHIWHFSPQHLGMFPYQRSGPDTRHLDPELPWLLAAAIRALSGPSAHGQALNLIQASYK